MADPIPSDLHISVCLKVDNDNGSMTCMPVVLAMRQHPDETHKALIAAIREISSSPESPKSFSLDLLDELLVHLDKDHHIPHHVLNKARYTMETYRDNARIVRQAAAANKKRKANNSATDFKFVNMGVRSSIPKPPPKSQTGQQKPWQASKYQEQVPSPVESTYRSVYPDTQQSASPVSATDQSDQLRPDQFARRDSYRPFYSESQQSASPGPVIDPNNHLRLERRPSGEPYRTLYPGIQPVSPVSGQEQNEHPGSIPPTPTPQYPEQTPSTINSFKPVFPQLQVSSSPISAPEQNDVLRHQQLPGREPYRTVYPDTRQSGSSATAPEQNNHPRSDQSAQTSRFQEHIPSPAEPYRTVYPRTQPPTPPERTNTLQAGQLPQVSRFPEQSPSSDSYKTTRPISQPSGSPVSAQDQNNNSQTENRTNPLNKVACEAQQSATPATASTADNSEMSRPEQLARAALSMSQKLESPPNTASTAVYSFSRDNYAFNGNDVPPWPPLPAHVPTSQEYELKVHHFNQLREQFTLYAHDGPKRSQDPQFQIFFATKVNLSHCREELRVMRDNLVNRPRKPLPNMANNSTDSPSVNTNTTPHTPTNQTFKFGPPPPPNNIPSQQRPPPPPPQTANRHQGFTFGPPPPPPPTPPSRSSPHSHPHPQTPSQTPPPPPPPQLHLQPQTQSQTLPNVSSILNSASSETKTLPPYLSIYGPTTAASTSTGSASGGQVETHAQKPSPSPGPPASDAAGDTVMQNGVTGGES